MKKILALIFALILCVSLCACSMFEGGKNYEDHTNLIAVAEYKNLYYDPLTGIVYMLFNEGYGNTGYGYMSAYYASNGLPYTYDISTHTLVEIQNNG